MIEDILQGLFGLGISFFRPAQETGKNGKTNLMRQSSKTICLDGTID